MEKKQTVQDMFNELGFKKEIDCLGIVRYDKEADEFTKEHVIFQCNRFACWSVSHCKEIDTLLVDKKLHKAIQKQIKELGWL